MKSSVSGCGVGVLAVCLVAASGGCTTGRAKSPSTTYVDVRDASIDAAQRLDAEDQKLYAAAKLDELAVRATDLLLEAAISGDAEMRANAIEALTLGELSDLEQVLASGLNDENLGVRTVAAMASGRRGVTSETAALEGLLDDPSPFVRSSAIYALARAKGEVDPTPLAMMIFNDPSPRVRAHVAFILGEMGNASAMPILRQAAKARLTRAAESEVRLFNLQIAEALVKLGDEEQVHPIRAALYPTRPEELEATALAVQIIGEVEDRGSIDQLIYLSATKDEGGDLAPAEIRLGIASALAKLGLKDGSFIADEFWEHESPLLRAQAVEVYGRIGLVEHLGRIEAALDDPDLGVRISAAAAVLRLAGEA